MPVGFDFSVAQVDSGLFVGSVELQAAWLGESCIWPPPMPVIDGMGHSSSPTNPPPLLPLTRDIISWDGIGNSGFMGTSVYLWDATAGAIISDPIPTRLDGSKAASQYPDGSLMWDAQQPLQWVGPFRFPKGHEIQVHTCGLGAAAGSGGTVWARYTAQDPAHTDPFAWHAADVQPERDRQIVLGGRPHARDDDIPTWQIRRHRPIRWVADGDSKWRYAMLAICASASGNVVAGVPTWNGGTATTLTPPGGKWPVGYLFVNLFSYNAPGYTGPDPGVIARIRIIP